MTVPNVNSANPVAAPVSPSASSSNGVPAGYISSQISDLGALKKENPKVYNSTMQSLCWGMCSQLKHANDDMIKRMKEERSRGG